MRVSQIVDDLYSHTRPDEGTAIPLPILVPEGTITSAHTGLTLSFLHRKEFGASNVGLLTGDASVNPTAPILCCTAEVLANASLRRGRELDCGLVVADEFHFYGDRDRGWAWQVPLVELPDAQFLLMSATFGDCKKFERLLTKNNAGRKVTTVGGGDRPVPLTYEYRTTPLLESVNTLLDTNRSPVYGEYFPFTTFPRLIAHTRLTLFFQQSVVNFTQKTANERAQDLCSTLNLTAAEKGNIKKEIGNFKFDTPVGNELWRYISHGVGVHHAGLLPKYRLLVEKLAGKGLLKVICGTDTLGVGVNVPIRSVLFTQLCKFDGNKSRLLTTREFQQIAGRAGRRGFDTDGFVWCQAPPHVVENLRAEKKSLQKAAAGGKAKNIKKAQAPEKGFVMWNEDSFKKGEVGVPETLDSSFEVTHGMLLAVLSRKGDGKKGLFNLLTKNHEPKIRQRKHARRAISMYRSLRDAGIVQEAGALDTSGRSVTLGFDLSDNFDLTQPLSLFAVEFLPSLLKKYGDDWVARSKGKDELYALDVLSTLESVLDTPSPVIYAQLNRMKRREMGKMKHDGVEFDDRVAVLDEMAAPAPLRDELEASYEFFKKAHPYVGDEVVKPKAIAREMYELGFDFNKYVVFHSLNRSEGAVLRYLTDAYKSLVQNVPANLKSPAVEDLEDWLCETIRQVDSSLIDEWEALKDPGAASQATNVEELAALRAARLSDSKKVFSSGRAFRVMVRNGAFRWVQLLAEGDEEDMKELSEYPTSRDRARPWGVDELYELIEPFWQSGHDTMATDQTARSPELFEVDETDPKHWVVTQKIKDPAGDLDWQIVGEVDVAESEEQGRAVLRLVSIERVGGIEKESDENGSENFANVPDEDDLWAAYEEEEEEDEEEDEDEEEK